MHRQQYKVRPNTTLKNRLTNETIYGTIVNERDIEGRQYWVMLIPQRNNAQLSFAKESWSIVKGK